ncbi:MAG: 3-hydroxybutyrate dehydrogenase [Verrucomicrobia bacterium]|nr:3-hydroxybutyrate dehydrogenase [Verrucomicrobiota bacterium]
MLAGKSALVTGSTSGIGLGLARALARAGANVMLNGFGDAAAIEALRRDLAAETGVRVAYHAADVSRPEAVAALVEAAEAAFGAVDILVNNAGLQHVAPVDEFPEEKWTLIQDVVLNSAFHATKAALPGMKRRNWGRILNLVSVHGLIASPYKSAYTAAKHGLVGLTKTVALEVAETGITCNAICPGYVRTPLVEGQIASQAQVHKLPPDRVIREVILAAQPSKRFVEIEEVAALAVFLCGENARSITGSSIPIDGGWTAR